MPPITVMTYQTVLNAAANPNDVVVGLFSGQKPMTVFMQQGSQIGQIAMQAGVGIGGMARALIGLAASGAAAALTNPYLLAAAAAAEISPSLKPSSSLASVT